MSRLSWADRNFLSAANRGDLVWHNGLNFRLDGVELKPADCHAVADLLEHGYLALPEVMPLPEPWQVLTTSKGRAELAVFR